jgi:hypothetical protein
MAAGTDAEKREAKQQIVSFENQPKKHQKAAGLRSAALSFKFSAVTNFLQSAIGRTTPSLRPSLTIAEHRLMWRQKQGLRSSCALC